MKKGWIILFFTQALIEINRQLLVFSTIFITYNRK